MDTKRYTHKIMKDNLLGTMDIYDDMIKIHINNNTRNIEYNFIKTLFLSSLNQEDFEIGLKNNEIIHLNIFNSKKENFTNSYNFMRKKCGLSEEKIDKPVIQKKEIFNYPKLPITMQSDILINKNILLQLNNESFLKDNLNKYPINLQCFSSFGIYEEFVGIENSIYNLNLTYDLLKSVEIINIKTKKTILNLATGASIIITPHVDDNLFESYIKLLQDHIYKYPINYNKINQYTTPNNYQNQYPYNNPPQQNMYNYNQPYTYIPRNKKSGLVCFIINLLFLGMGYAYVDKWGRGLLNFFILWPLMILIGLVTFGIPTLLFWIYVVLNTNSMVDKYNRGEPY